ncbi:hypothetical protein [Streptomyces sp. NBC_00826]|uniref:hypothetical protein n=1 Tax=Streptomyces sp. NBC_00826 TaxID=2975845 RepID=UPI003868CC77|nr:hypothetical protein OG832_45675 [Streptomyces sp. NBC_00826]
MAPRTRRSLVTVAASVLAFTGLGLTVPAQANAATCKTLDASVMNSAGNWGGNVHGQFCIAASSAYLDDRYNHYVQDYAADGVAARAYVTASGITNGPLATDTTATPGGTPLDLWESTNPGVTSVRLWICLGTAFPGSSGARCASDIMYG